MSHTAPLPPPISLVNVYNIMYIQPCHLHGCVHSCDLSVHLYHSTTIRCDTVNGHLGVTTGQDGTTVLNDQCESVLGSFYTAAKLKQSPHQDYYIAIRKIFIKKAWILSIINKIT